jgi:hypothetical protein
VQLDLDDSILLQVYWINCWQKNVSDRKEWLEQKGNLADLSV